MNLNRKQKKKNEEIEDKTTGKLRSLNERTSQIFFFFNIVLFSLSHWFLLFFIQNIILKLVWPLWSKLWFIYSFLLKPTTSREIEHDLNTLLLVAFFFSSILTYKYINKKYFGEVKEGNFDGTKTDYSRSSSQGIQCMSQTWKKNYFFELECIWICFKHFSKLIRVFEKKLGSFGERVRKWNLLLASRIFYSFSFSIFKWNFL